MKSSIKMGFDASLNPIFSFNSIVDADYGLIRLIASEYFDINIFNDNYFKDKSSLDVIFDLYDREDINPLYVIAKDNVSKQLLDEYYTEFITNKEAEIYKYSITTDILTAMQEFNANLDIKPSILCYNELQLSIMEEEKALSSNKKVLLDPTKLQSSIKSLNLYNQFFFKSLDELEPFSKFGFKKFYISTFRPNFSDGNEGLEINNNSVIGTIIKNKNAINIFDIYNKKKYNR